MDTFSYCFYSACGHGYIEIVKLLLNDERIDISKADNNGWTAFFIACQKGQVGIVKLLFQDRRVNDDINKLNDNGQTPFYVACENGHIEIVSLFLENPRGNLFFCSVNKSLKWYVKKIVDKNVKLKENGQAALETAQKIFEC